MLACTNSRPDKSILAVIGPDVQQVTGALQVCTGQQGGCEAAVHAMSLVFQDPNTEAVLLVDATNAFNCLNHKAALQNVAANWGETAAEDSQFRRRCMA